MPRAKASVAKSSPKSPPKAAPKVKPTSTLQAEHQLVDPDELRHHKIQRSRQKSVMTLEPQEREFCILVAQGMDKADAAAKAGYEYPAVDAARLMKRTTVQRALRDLFEKNMEISEVTREEIIHGMRDAIMIARTMSDPQTMIRGYRELGLMHGMYETRVKVEITGGMAQVAKQMEGKSDAELLKVIAERSRVLSDAEMEAAEDATYAED